MPSSYYNLVSVGRQYQCVMPLSLYSGPVLIDLSDISCKVLPNIYNCARTAVQYTPIPANIYVQMFWIRSA